MVLVVILYSCGAVERGDDTVFLWCCSAAVFLRCCGGGDEAVPVVLCR